MDDRGEFHRSKLGFIAARFKGPITRKFPRPVWGEQGSENVSIPTPCPAPVAGRCYGANSTNCDGAG